MLKFLMNSFKFEITKTMNNTFRMDIELYSCLISNILLVERVLIKRYFEIKAQKLTSIQCNSIQ
jgi:hypothetical protein